MSHVTPVSDVSMMFWLRLVVLFCRTLVFIDVHAGVGILFQMLVLCCFEDVNRTSDERNDVTREEDVERRQAAWFLQGELWERKSCSGLGWGFKTATKRERERKNAGRGENLPPTPLEGLRGFQSLSHAELHLSRGGRWRRDRSGESQVV